MRVKIIKSDLDINWYSEHIGKEFDVEERNEEFVILDNTQIDGNEDLGVLYGIAKEDCEIVEEVKMVTAKSWKEFRTSGLLWFINGILHMFGWAIILDIDDGEVINAYPARVKFRGFNEKNNTDGYIKVSQYLKDNIDELLKESME